MSIPLIWNVLLYYITCVNIVYTNSTKNVCVFMDYFGKEYDLKKIPCSTHTVCQKVFKIANIRVPPYNDDPTEVLKKDIPDILKRCCGKCVKYNEIYDFKNISGVDHKSLAEVHFAYPFLSSASTTSLFGFYFLPLEDPTAAVYITKKNSDIKLWKSIFKLYPVIIVCLLSAVISGFICWVIETWNNQEEFPRAFLLGWFEGFWWAFVSMTTVGYGDKCPKSALSKIYSIGWIFVGIIACGIITGEITGQVINSNKSEPPSLKSKRVGALQFRSYDTYVIAQKGGKIVRNDPLNATNFMEDVLQLIGKLQNDKIDGILLDRQTLVYINDKMSDEVKDDKSDDNIKNKGNFFIKGTLRTEKTYEGKRFTYGLLIRDKEDYEFFKDYIQTRNEHNTNIYNMDWADFLIDSRTDDFVLYSPDYELLFTPNKYFQRAMYAIGSIIVFILLFGIVYEMKRRRNTSKKVAFS